MPFCHSSNLSFSLFLSPTLSFSFVAVLFIFLASFPCNYPDKENDNRVRAIVKNPQSLPPPLGSFFLFFFFLFPLTTPCPPSYSSFVSFIPSLPSTNLHPTPLLRNPRIQDPLFVPLIKYYETLINLSRRNRANKCPLLQSIRLTQRADLKAPLLTHNSSNNRK